MFGVGCRCVSGCMCVCVGWCVGACVCGCSLVHAHIIVFLNSGV